MQNIKNTVRVWMIYAAVVVLAGGYPMTAYAETVEGTPPPSTTTTAPETPAASTPTPPEPTYSYDPNTKRWSSDKWQYNTTTGKYEAVPAPSTSQVVMPLPTTNPSTGGQPSTGAESGSTAVTDTTKNTIGNNINSGATTGDAAVNKNTTGGSAETGDATSIATLMNSINSSTGGNGAEFATFVTDVVGDVHGDIMLYPMLLKAMLQAAASPSSDTTITAKTSNNIENNVNLNAVSGNAAVTNNTTAGSATTGAANTVANIMNIINTIIAANQSFVGTINIHGNLDGDILVAPDFLPQLLASNAGSSSAPTKSLDVTSNNTQLIANNVSLNAESGNAVVANNTKAGSAKTGDASTNVVLLNLSGHQVVARNSLLVFVNVLGTWVGIIVDAPTGATAAALGNGVTSHTNSAPDVTITTDTDSKVTNNVNLNSQSGNATVTGNTTAGNATTGNATASANIANIVGSQMGLSDWFGVLFINVFGSWHGSFGVDTERGTIPITAAPAAKPGAKPDKKRPSSPAPVFQFVADTAAKAATTTQLFSGTEEKIAPEAQPAVAKKIQKDTDKNPDTLAGIANTTPRGLGAAVTPLDERGEFDFLPFVAATFLLGLGVIATKNIIGIVRNRIG